MNCPSDSFRVLEVRKMRVGIGLLSQGTGQDGRKWPQAVPGWISGKFLHGKGAPTLAQGGIPTLEGFKSQFKMWRWHSGTWGSGGLSSAGELLDSTFSSLDNSMIYDSPIRKGKWDF